MYHTYPVLTNLICMNCYQAYSFIYQVFAKIAPNSIEYNEKILLVIWQIYQLDINVMDIFVQTKIFRVDEG